MDPDRRSGPRTVAHGDAVGAPDGICFGREDSSHAAPPSLSGLAQLALDDAFSAIAGVDVLSFTHVNPNMGDPLAPTKK